ncbi:MAG TPA: hypothetical protein VIH57_01115 [Bacteroidales bacterium]
MATELSEEYKKNFEMIDVVQICKNVLVRISMMDYEKDGGTSSEQLIFPKKIQAKGTKLINRISEQELRLLFIEEFKKLYVELFYSIETPTVYKFNFRKSYETIKTDYKRQSALLDMCIFERSANVYNRILNIEFKHKNLDIKKLGKDILKLMQEKNDGAFILLLDNTNKGTFCNANETGVFNKLYKSFSGFQINWNNKQKSIQMIILSLKQEKLIYRTINKTDLINLKDIFFLKNDIGNINDINGNGWNNETI